MNKTSKSDKTIFQALVPTIIFTLLLTFVQIFVEINYLEKISLALQPRNLQNIYTIFTAGIIHKDWTHFFSNIFSLSTLIFIMFYFHPKKAGLLIPVFYLLSNLLLWLIGRDAYHLGSSILLYALASYLFFYGLIMNDAINFGVSLAIIILNSGIFMGIMPLVDNYISWDGHLSGFLVGFIFAMFEKSTSSNDKNDKLENFYDFSQITSTEKIKFFYTFEEKNENQNYDYHKSKNSSITNFYTFYNNNIWPKRAF